TRCADLDVGSAHLDHYRLICRDSATAWATRRVRADLSSGYPVRVDVSTSSGQGCGTRFTLR
ncbi:MAG TPA: hypothetical protein VFO16_12840, partial [Pseudonocardiaceae bacterium]|nr:hypothetical protein [Pseudonocardiaceae bacterium]